jgi:hypothetical protein
MSDENNTFEGTETDTETITTVEMPEKKPGETAEQAQSADDKSGKFDRVDRPQKQGADWPWPMTPPMPDPVIPKADAESSRTPTERDKSLRESLNQPLAAKLNDLQKEYTRNVYYLRDGSGAIPGDLKKIIAARQVLIRNAVNALIQSPKPPRIGATEQAHVQMAHLSRPAMRAAKLEKLKAALASQETDPTYFGSISINPVKSIPPIVQWLLQQENVWMGVTMCRLDLARYELARFKSFGLTHPKDRVEEIKGEIATGPDAATIEKLQDELATLSLPTSELSALAASREIHDKWKPFEMSLDFLLSSALFDLEEEQERLIEDEKYLYRTHAMGLEYEPTKISKSLEPVIKQFRDLLAENGKQLHYMPGVSTLPRDGEQTALMSIFGQSILGD